MSRRTVKADTPTQLFGSLRPHSPFTEQDYGRASP